MIRTLNELLKLFEGFSQAHQMINGFGYGDNSEIATSKQMLFPYMWVNSDNTSVDTTVNRNQTPEHAFIIGFLDQENIQENYEEAVGFNSNNRQEIMSDTFQLAQDFITFINTYGHKYKIRIVEGSVSLQPTYDETTDKAYGWALSISLRTAHNNCDLPGDFENIEI